MARHPDSCHHRKIADQRRPADASRSRPEGVAEKRLQPRPTVERAARHNRRMYATRPHDGCSRADLRIFRAMPKILLVEDNEMNRDMLSRRLRRKGYDVVMAVDGEQAVAMSISESPDLI